MKWVTFECLSLTFNENKRRLIYLRQRSPWSVGNESKPKKYSKINQLINPIVAQFWRNEKETAEYKLMIQAQNNLHKRSTSGVGNWVKWANTCKEKERERERERHANDNGRKKRNWLMRKNAKREDTTMNQMMMRRSRDNTLYGWIDIDQERRGAKMSLDLMR